MTAANVPATQEVFLVVSRVLYLSGRLQADAVFMCSRWPAKKSAIFCFVVFIQWIFLE